MSILKNLKLPKLLPGPEEALKNVENNDKINYIIYCDKSTVKYSQRWYRHIFVSQLKVYLTKKNDDFEKYKLEFNYGKYTIVSKNGDAIKSSPEDTDTDSLGHLLVNSVLLI